MAAVSIKIPDMVKRYIRNEIFAGGTGEESIAHFGKTVQELDMFRAYASPWKVIRDEIFSPVGIITLLCLETFRWADATLVGDNHSYKTPIEKVMELAEEQTLYEIWVNPEFNGKRSGITLTNGMLTLTKEYKELQRALTGSDISQYILNLMMWNDETGVEYKKRIKNSHLVAFPDKLDDTAFAELITGMNWNGFANLREFFLCHNQDYMYQKPLWDYGLCCFKTFGKTRQIVNQAGLNEAERRGIIRDSDASVNQDILIVWADGKGVDYRRNSVLFTAKRFKDVISHYGTELKNFTAKEMAACGGICV